MTFRRSLFSFLLFVLVRSTEGRESASRVDTTTGFLYRRPFDVRGGSSSPNSFQARTPGKVQGVPGQTSPSSFTTARPNPQSREQEDVSTKEMIDSFLTRDSRNSFIARVYAILSVQLVVTALSCVLFGVHPTLSKISTDLTAISHESASLVAAIPLISILVSTVSWFIVCISPSARRTAPLKWLLLGLFTLGESISVGFLSSLYDFRSVVSAMGATAVASVTVSAYTILQTNPDRDLSQWGASLSSWAMILLTYLIIGMLQETGVIPTFLPFSQMFYSLCASCLFSAFLAYHTKLIVAGKHSKYRMNDKDYVFGAMSLYSDIVNIFLYLLQLLGEPKDSN